MSSLVLALVVALLASLAPLMVFGLDGQTAAAVAGLTLLLWPLVVLSRWFVVGLYRLLTGRGTPGRP